MNTTPRSTTSETDSPPDDPSNEDEFQQALSELIRTARSNDVDVCGGWRIDGVEGAHDLGVEIFRLAPRDD